ncbi:MAG: N-methyl-L-tryptophan oxidase [Desulfofustis sp.]|nr:N-methyl-L-tryptophan oxidase [Desulfofustis sp.]MBT8346875.1 N-methyl-L-tryptophan oxidase [Desulfofustis sp.]
MNSYDFIIVGLGTVGSATCMNLARRGYRVLGLDQFSPPHNLGSHHGQSRSVRRAYPEGSSYVKMALKSWELWRKLEKDQGQQLLVTTENITFGAPQSPALIGFIKSAHAHDIPHEYLNGKEIRQRWPQFLLPDHFCGGLEIEAGIVFPELAVSAFLDEARKSGVELHVDERVEQWVQHPTGIHVKTGRTSYEAGRLLLAAGAWSRNLIGRHADILQPKRVAVHWLKPPDIRDFAMNNFPVNFWQVPVDGDPAFPEGYKEFYSLPALEPEGVVKIAFHNGLIDGDPATMSREAGKDETRAIEKVISTYLPGLIDSPLRADVCSYMMTPDNHFYLGRLPGMHDVFCAALTGHGFKFAPVLGELLADLLTDMPSEIDITLFSPDRFTTQLI